MEAGLFSGMIILGVGAGGLTLVVGAGTAVCSILIRGLSCCSTLSGMDALAASSFSVITKLTFGAGASLWALKLVMEHLFFQYVFAGSNAAHMFFLADSAASRSV